MIEKLSKAISFGGTTVTDYVCTMSKRAYELCVPGSEKKITK